MSGKNVHKLFEQLASVDEVCDHAKLNDTVLIIGMKDGYMNFSCSDRANQKTIAETIGLLEIAKHDLMRMLAGMK